VKIYHRFRKWKWDRHPGDLINLHLSLIKWTPANKCRISIFFFAFVFISFRSLSYESPQLPPKRDLYRVRSTASFFHFVSVKSSRSCLVFFFFPLLLYRFIILSLISFVSSYGLSDISQSRRNSSGNKRYSSDKIKLTYEWLYNRRIHVVTVIARALATYNLALTTFCKTFSSF